MGISLLVVLTARAFGGVRASYGDQESAIGEHLLFLFVCSLKSPINSNICTHELVPTSSLKWVHRNLTCPCQTFKLHPLKRSRCSGARPASNLPFENTWKYCFFFARLDLGCFVQREDRGRVDDLRMCRPCKVANRPLMSYEWISRRGAGFYWSWAVQECSPAQLICMLESVS